MTLQVAREASLRVLGLRPFDVQLIGGMILHEGEIAEMRTGEGKTLVSVLPAYLNALTGKGVHVVTVNDYLAKRDSEWVGQVHKFLGMEVGLVQTGLTVNRPSLPPRPTPPHFNSMLKELPCRESCTHHVLQSNVSGHFIRMGQ